MTATPYWDQPFISLSMLPLVCLTVVPHAPPNDRLALYRCFTLPVSLLA